MKCISCKNQINRNKIICSSCRSLEKFIHYLTFHRCLSFQQEEGASKGYCENYLECAPIKYALKKEILFDERLGHIVCPYAEENLKRIVYGQFTKEDLKSNYLECID